MSRRDRGGRCGEPPQTWLQAADHHQSMQSIAPDVWQVPGPPIRIPGGGRLPTCSTVIRLADQNLIVYSPVDLDDAAGAAIAALGDVAHLVVPSLLHHPFAEAAARRWPKASVHAVPGVQRKQPGLRIDRELPGHGWPSVEVELIGGTPKLNEVVLFHRPSGTLVCADLFFHITHPENLQTRLVLALAGTGGGRLAQSRAWSFLRKDRAAARASVDKILGWPIARVAMCHGSAMEIDAAELAPRMARLYGGHIASAQRSDRR
jgi:hypothetical protein